MKKRIITGSLLGAVTGLALMSAPPPAEAAIPDRKLCDDYKLAPKLPTSTCRDEGHKPYTS